MLQPMVIAGRTALVTGAASGIGRALALNLARRGCHLALADRDAAGLDATAAEAAGAGVRVSRHAVDLVDAAAIGALPAAVLGSHAGLDLLVNNAGVALSGTFEQVSAEDFEWLFDVNFWSVVRTTRACLPLLRRSDDGAIVNMSSLYGLVAPPGQTAYAASKFAIRGFSQALRMELAGTRLGVIAVHPGGVATAIVRNARSPAGMSPEVRAERIARFEKLLRLSPEKAADIIVRGVVRRRPRILVGPDVKLFALAERLLPVSYGGVLPKLRTLLALAHRRA